MCYAGGDMDGVWKSHLALIKAIIGIFGVTLLVMAGILTFQRRQPTEAAWLTVAAGETDYQQSLYRMRPDGSSIQHISDFEDYFWTLASAPDGRSIAFVAEGIASSELYLFTIKADGTQQQMISDDIRWDNRGVSPLVWSPNSEWIAFWTWQNGGLVVNRVQADGREQQQISRESFDMGNNIIWSPDSEWLLLSKIASNRDRELYRVRADGRVVERIMDNDISEAWMLWSPDGEWIVFHATTPDGWGIFRIRPDGSNEEQVLGSRLMSYFGNPIWSPDGQWLSFTTYPSEDTCVQHLMRPDGSDLHSIAELCAAPQWSADSQWLIYRAYREGNYRLFRRNITSGQVEELFGSTVHVQTVSSSALIDLPFAGGKLLLMDIFLLVSFVFGWYRGSQMYTPS